MSNDKSKTILQKYTPFVKFLLFNKQCKTYKIERFFDDGRVVILPCMTNLFILTFNAFDDILKL